MEGSVVMQESEDRKAHSVQILKSIKDTDLVLDIVLMEQEMLLGKLAALGPGSILPFDKKVTDSATITVNGRELAKGDVVQCGVNYALKITEFTG
ncbi:MAG: Type flagellar switch regulator (C-ring) FliN C-term [Chlamydiales bacterium]|jgi:flagellar motor switch/type III secretory pathway protein FliN|nr:Type flagellar switch regulator (C-ring) FliN C-term [Chlamydiales bacterium]